MLDESLDVRFIPIADIEAASIALAWLRDATSVSVPAFVEIGAEVAAALGAAA